MVDVNTLKSHPDKLLFTHVNGVVENVQKLTAGLALAKKAKLAAIFHDLGKINPHFQDRLVGKHNIKYSHHAYLSAFALFAFCCNKTNRDLIEEFINKDNFYNEFIALIVLISKHHGHLPNFKQEERSIKIIPYILSKDEIKSMFHFLDDNLNKLPVEDFIKYFNGFENIEPVLNLVGNKKAQKNFEDELIFKPRQTLRPLDFFLETQFSFASLIQADKADAMGSFIIDEDKERIEKFCQIYPDTLSKHISKFEPDSELNKIRTQIRSEGVLQITKEISHGKRIFELTAPTGSGKTIMLLSLASRIIKSKGSYRIIYALPFLSITEQVEKEVLDIFKDFREQNFIQRIDSKSSSLEFEELQKELDAYPNAEKIKTLDFLAFQEQVFAYPFVITTFVRFFETLLSNRNATLLKLPNFAKSIFLLDEIQSLPPRLYTFFVAYLSRFCEKFDCYAVISTATQPNYQLPSNTDISSFFSNYEKPIALLDHEKYFKKNVFNRYQIIYQKKSIGVQELSLQVVDEEKSVLIIVNTIDDSKELYKALSEELDSKELFLLNTHFTPNDRKRKIETVKDRLQKQKKTILVSTQLIEAGVDIDFPVLYRDFTLVSSIVQSAGRCNRNGKLKTLGKVVLINLVKDGKSRANLIYGRGKDKEILKFTKKAIGLKTKIQERELLDTQKLFFDEIAQKLNFGLHSQKKYRLEFNFIEDIKKCAFDKIGRFQLIDEMDFGEQKQYYVPRDDSDDTFDRILNLEAKIKEAIQKRDKDWQSIKMLNIKIKSLYKEMANQIISVRLKKNDPIPILGNQQDYNGVYELDYNSYNFDRGLSLSVEDCFI